MQDLNTPKQAGSASLSRRTFISIAAAGTAATLPAAALVEAGETAPRSPRRPEQLNPDEKLLGELIAEQSRLRSLRDGYVRQMLELERQVPHLFQEVRLPAVVGRLEDYPPIVRNRSLGYGGTVLADQFFSHMMDNILPNFFHPVRERVQKDWENARKILLRKQEEEIDWRTSSGHRALETEEDRLYELGRDLEKQIIAMPCTSARMAAMKADFALHIVQIDEFSDFTGVLTDVLRSVIPLGEA